MSIAPNSSVKTSIKIGLDSNSKNGTWQTFTRDLEADLKQYEPDNELLTRATSPLVTRILKAKTSKTNH